MGTHYKLLLRVSAAVSLVVCAKLACHFMGWEFISVNPLFSGVVAADVFLMGFLLNGVMSDFKESERLPGELAASLENLAQEILGVQAAKPEAVVAPSLGHLLQLAQGLMAWFHKTQKTAALMAQIDGLTPRLARLESWTQATLLARMKQEQSSIRRVVVRIHTIRETDFIASGYLLAYLMTVFLCLGLVLARIEPFTESLFFVTIISCFVIFLLMLIRDLDNPFGYYQKSSGEDVSLKPLEDAINRLACHAAVENCDSAQQSSCPPPNPKPGLDCTP